MWTPITLNELQELIAKEGPTGEVAVRLWDSIRISPEKWVEPEFGKDGNGFWAAGLFGNSVIWYNDIEDGFNVSSYSKYGLIDEYSCDQSELWIVISQLSRFILTGEVAARRGGPQPLVPE